MAKLKFICLFLIVTSFCLYSKFITKEENKELNDIKVLRQEIKKQFYSNLSPLIVVTIMVKDEEEVMEKTLEPFVKAGFDSFFVFDTGSTDKTIEVTKNFFKKYDIKNGYIEQESFIDFSTSRNRALDLTKEKFPNAGFILMIDAEWYINNAFNLLGFCKNILNDQNAKKQDSFLIRLVKENKEFYNDRLVRANSNARFSGVVHEVISNTVKGKCPFDVYFLYAPTKKGIEKSLKRWEKDAELLLKEHKKNPHDCRTLFYLGQTYDCLGKKKEASKYYKLRTKLKGHDEEDYISFYRLGKSIQHLIQEGDESVSWSEALEAYHQAIALRPHRAEPLFAIAYQYFLNKNYSVAYIYAQRASQLPYPKTDILFIEKTVYDLLRWELLGICAWFLKEYKIGENAILQALKAKPDCQELNKKLKSYLFVKQNL